MQSKIRIEFDFETNQPVIRFTQAQESDDLRDTMLKAFIEKATNTKSQMYFTFPDFVDRRDNSVLDLRCEVKPELSNSEKINELEQRCQDIIWSNAPEDLKFINDFCNILRERTK